MTTEEKNKFVSEDQTWIVDPDKKKKSNKLFKSKFYFFHV